MKLCVIVCVVFILGLVTADAVLKKKLIHSPETCERVAEHGSKVFIDYTGKLSGGQVFDSGQAFEFVVGKSAVIEGIRGMCLGEKRELIIPPEKAYPQIIYYVKCFDASRYGSLGVKGRIPPHATLTFEVELVSFDEPPPASFWERIGTGVVALIVLGIIVTVVFNALFAAPQQPTDKNTNKKQGGGGKRK